MTTYRTIGLIEDDLADIDAAWLAIRAMWARLHTLAEKAPDANNFAYLAGRPAITYADIMRLLRRYGLSKEDVDCLSDDLRTIETGLTVIHKYCTDLRQAAAIDLQERRNRGKST